MVRVLSVGDDAVLLESRTMVLRQAGYMARLCTSREALEVMSREAFDVVLVCRSVSPELGHALAREIHTSWRTRVIRLAPRSGEADALYDSAIDMARGPASFLRALDEFVAGRPYAAEPVDYQQSLH